MNIIIMILVLICFQTGISIHDAREAYFHSSAGPLQARKFENLLDAVSDNEAPVLTCYKGAAQMLIAKSAVNPISKLAFFKRGKTLIEQGVIKDTTCVESRFIRFSIQRNLPGFLGYNQNLRMDSLMIARALPDMSDDDLRFKITSYYKRLKMSLKR